MANDYYITEDDVQRSEDEYNEALHQLTYEALKEAMKFLPSDKMDVLFYHCGFSEEDFK